MLGCVGEWVGCGRGGAVSTWRLLSVELIHVWHMVAYWVGIEVFCER